MVPQVLFWGVSSVWIYNIWKVWREREREELGRKWEREREQKREKSRIWNKGNQSIVSSPEKSVMLLCVSWWRKEWDIVKKGTFRDGEEINWEEYEEMLLENIEIIS